MGVEQMILDASKAVTESMKTSSEGGSMMGSHYNHTIQGDGVTTGRGVNKANNSIKEEAEGEDEDSD